jgi:hypothetical protein
MYPCRDLIGPTKASNTYAAFLAGAAFDYDFLNFGDPALAGQWSQFCTVCDGLTVPPSPQGSDPAPARPKLVFRRAMGIVLTGFRMSGINGILLEGGGLD